MSIKDSHTVPKLKEQQRISDYAVNVFNRIPTRKGIKKAIKRGQVYLNGAEAHTGDWLSGGEVIELVLEDADSPQYELSYPVIFEDDYLAAIHKPAGIPIHSNGHRNIQNTLSYNLKTSKVADGLQLFRPVHRLDYSTEGLLLIAKCYGAMTTLVNAFAANGIQKEYVAVTIGSMNTAGLIDEPIDGKDCITDYELIKTIKSDKYSALNLVSAKITQGRRNQIRKHFAHIGNPILGDKKFFVEGKVSFGNGLYLIARALKFQHPILKKDISLEIPLSKKYNRLFPD